jgi:hypothetical protein
MTPPEWTDLIRYDEPLRHKVVSALPEARRALAPFFDPFAIKMALDLTDRFAANAFSRFYSKTNRTFPGGYGRGKAWRSNVKEWEHYHLAFADVLYQQVANATNWRAERIISMIDRTRKFVYAWKSKP